MRKDHSQNCNSSDFSLEKLQFHLKCTWLTLGVKFWAFDRVLRQKIDKPINSVFIIYSYYVEMGEIRT